MHATTTSAACPADGHTPAKTPRLPGGQSRPAQPSVQRVRHSTLTATSQRDTLPGCSRVISVWSLVQLARSPCHSVACSLLLAASIVPPLNGGPANAERRERVRSTDYGVRMQSEANAASRCPPPARKCVAFVGWRAGQKHGSALLVFGPWLGVVNRLPAVPLHCKEPSWSGPRSRPGRGLFPPHDPLACHQAASGRMACFWLLCSVHHPAYSVVARVVARASRCHPVSEPVGAKGDGCIEWTRR